MHASEEEYMQVQTPIGRSKRRLEDNIKKYLKEDGDVELYSSGSE
jgi:hypothetical protein